jgi:hypothetical protein
LVEQVQWERTSLTCETSSDGYKISASKVYGTLVFSAWSLPECPELSYWQWHKAVGKVHYEIGDLVPKRRRHLGYAATAESARLICEERSRREA